MLGKKSGKFQKGLHFIALMGTAMTVLGAILSALGGLFVVRLFRYLDTAGRALPTLEKAAKIYLHEHGEEQITLKNSGKTGFQSDSFKQKN